MKVKKRHWHLRELRALEKACKHYAPILGANRDDSTRKDAGPGGQVLRQGDALGRHQRRHRRRRQLHARRVLQRRQHRGHVQIAENDTSFGADVDASLEWVCTHELSHGLMDYIEEDLRKAAGYWKDYSTKTGAGEEPWSGYAKTSLGEDLAESATAYFIKRKAFKKKCPRSASAVVDAAVKAWKPSPAAAAASAAASGAATAGLGAAAAGAAGAGIAGAAAAAGGAAARGGGS